MALITLILALILAWPTFGLSLVAWLVYVSLSTKAKGAKLNNLDDQIARFKKRYFAADSQASFVRILAGTTRDFGHDDLTDDDMMNLGNIMVRFIVTHPEMTTRFERIISRYEALPQFGPRPAYGCAMQAIAIEREMTGSIGGSLHKLCYEVLQVLCTNNPEHRIMRKIDVEYVECNLGVIDMSREHEREMGRSQFCYQ
jgi:hypothetical protein